MLRTSLASRFSRSNNARRRKTTNRGLRLEALEERILLAAFMVTNTDDSGPGSLRQAIEDANALPGADEIEVSRRARGTITLTTGQLEITDDLKIQGPGASQLTVSGNAETRVFLVTAANVSFSRMTIADGRTSDFPIPNPPAPDTFINNSGGAGLLNVSGSVRLSHVDVVNNVVTGNALGGGGGIANVFGASLTISHSEFSNNLAEGFFFAGAGAVLNDAGSALAIEHSTFIGNTARALGGGNPVDPLQGIGGGGAVINGGGSQVNIVQSRFLENVARGGDGAAGQPGSLGTSGAILSSNNSLIAPPGPSVLRVEHTLFIGNEARGGDGGNGGDGQDGGAAGGANGGAISNDFGGVASITNSLFLHNRSIGGSGGDGGAGANGGGTNVFGLLGAAGGGAIINVGSTLAVNSSRFFGNQAIGDNGGNGGLGGNGADGADVGGGALLNAVSVFDTSLVPTVEVTRSTFFNNAATGGRGGDGEVAGEGGDGLGGALMSLTGEANMRRSRLLFNRAVGGDGGPNGNGGDGQGGGVYNGENSTLTLDRSIVALNKAFGGLGAAGSGVGTGGGLFNIGTLNASGRDLDRIFANWASDDCDNLFDNGLCV